jgi:methyl-accepting chemotaxis protein
VSWPFFESLRDEVNITRWYYYEAGPEGRIFLRVYRGDTALDTGSFGDAPKTGVLERARQTGKTTSGIEVGSSALAVRVVAPLHSAEGTTIGYLALGETVAEYLRVIAEQTGADYAMFLDKDTMDHEQWRALKRQQGETDNWDERSKVVLAASTVKSPALLVQAPDGGTQDGPRSLGVVRDAQHTYAVGTFPILDVSGASVGFVYVVKDVTELAGLFRNVQLGLLLGFMLLAVVMSVVVVIVLQRLVFARLDTMIVDMEHMSLSVAANDWDALAREREPRSDEIGAFERFFTTFIALIADALRSAGEKKEPPER